MTMQGSISAARVSGPSPQPDEKAMTLAPVASSVTRLAQDHV